MFCTGQHIRSRTRGPSYFAQSERLASAFIGGPLHVAPEYHGAVAVDLAAILDTCYERVHGHGAGDLLRLRRTTEGFEDAANLDIALESLKSSQARMRSTDCDLSEVASALVAAVAIAGYDAISNRLDASAAQDWLLAWQRSLKRHNEQQELHTAWCVVARLPSDARATLRLQPRLHGLLQPPRSTTFRDGVSEYLDMFSETSAASLALVGAIPFADALAGPDLRQVAARWKESSPLLEVVARLVRLALDVRFDSDEPLSAGVYGTAAQRRVSPDSFDRRDLSRSVEPCLREVWREEMTAALANEERACVDENATPSLRRLYRNLSSATLVVANQIAIGRPGA